MANPTLLEMPIARDGAKNSIPSTTSPTTGLLSQQYGWQDINSMPVQQGGKAPSRLDFNGVLNLLSNILFYAQKGWQFEWDSSQAYYAGCIVKDTSDGKMYQCLNDVTSTTAPHADTTNWQLWDLSMLANYLPLAGGAMTGPNIKRNVDTSLLNLIGGTQTNSSQLQLYGRDHASFPGQFWLISENENGYASLRANATGDSEGDLIWVGNDLGSSAIVGKSLTKNGYVKYADGRMEQWAVWTHATNGGIWHYLPLTFINTDFTFVLTSDAYDTGTSLGKAASGIIVDGGAISVYAPAGLVYCYAVGNWK